MYTRLIIWVVVIGGTFLVLWRSGQWMRLSNYVRETMEELKKCTWPTWPELKGSTVVVSISIALLGGFTVLADWIFSTVVYWIS